MTRLLVVFMVALAVLTGVASYTLSWGLAGLGAARLGLYASSLSAPGRVAEERAEERDAAVNDTTDEGGGSASDGAKADAANEGGGSASDGAMADGGDDAMTDASADADDAPVPSVDWPTLVDLDGRETVTTTTSFVVYLQDDNDPLLVAHAGRWAPQLETLLARIETRTDRALAHIPVNVVFSRAYDARCPARGLATPRGSEPRIEVYLDERTTDAQVRAVLAHEIAHHVTITEDFVGDHVLTEGLANWAAADEMLVWQGIESWDEAVRTYLAEGTFVSITDPAAQNPVGDEDCLARRDRVYNARTSFVSWMVVAYGLETLLEMPCLLVPEETADDDTEPRNVCVPDYRNATGVDLATLEERWLEEVRADR